ncbi:low temperature viability protein [Stagonosporopsis vannaccii]|nr:low temperature viability protein [Stagonosporopsis vannaccii]
MPRRKFIDKKTAINYRLVHRAQNDPRIHDEDAPQMVFAETAPANLREGDEPAGSSRASQYSSASRLSQWSAASGRSKIKSRGDLESEYGGDVRRNEGEAANYGIFYDDSKYDYMQHMRDLNSGTGDAYFIEAKDDKKKGKEKFDLADALKNASLDDRQSDAGYSMNSTVSSVSDVFGEDMAPSEFVRKTTYQDQQNIPDALAGFQPDMDPRLREVLEALEDDAYVDDDEDIFDALQEDGFELNQREFEAAGQFDADRDALDRFLDEDDEGWESDDTVRASSPSQKPKPAAPLQPGELPAPDEAPPLADAGDMAYMEEFKKFKNDVKASKAPKPAAPSDMQSSVMTGASALTAGGRRKKRKGAMTNPSSYSMSSSALHRTDALSLLDERFEKIEEEYADDGFDFPDDASMVSGMSRMSGLSKMSGMTGASQWSSSEAPPLRSDFDSIMDDFLGNHMTVGKAGRHVRKGKVATGMEQLDEVRQGLGKARMSERTQQRYGAQKAQFI